MSIINEIVCRCLSFFIGNIFVFFFYVFLNMIDFNIVWSKFDLVNVVVYGIVIVLFVVYVIVVIFL